MGSPGRKGDNGLSLIAGPAPASGSAGPARRRYPRKTRQARPPRRPKAESTDPTQPPLGVRQARSVLARVLSCSEVGHWRPQLVAQQLMLPWPLLLRLRRKLAVFGPLRQRPPPTTTPMEASAPVAAIVALRHAMVCWDRRSTHRARAASLLSVSCCAKAHAVQRWQKV